MNLKAARGAETRRQLLATATDLFASQGYEATSIDNVLDAAGVSRGALYHHFPGKEALFEAVLESVEEQLAADVVAAAEAAEEPRLALQAGCLAWLQRLRDPVIRRIVLVDAPAVVGWQRWREIDECHWFGLLKEALIGALPPQRLDPVSVDVLAHMLHAALNELAFVVARAGDPQAATAAGESALDALLGRVLEG